METPDPGLEWATLAVRLLQTIVWPTVATFLIVKFYGPLKALLDKSGQADFKFPFGIELSFKQVAESAAAAGVALGKQSAEKNEPVQDAALKNIASAFSLPDKRSKRSLNEASILWVDDIPLNNRALINAFQSLGIRVFQAVSTDLAITMLKQNYDVIISDMSRPPDREAGLTLIKYLKEKNITVPVIIFAAYWASKNSGREESIGAVAITNDASVVYRKTLEIIQNAS